MVACDVLYLAMPIPFLACCTGNLLYYLIVLYVGHILTIDTLRLLAYAVVA